MYPRLVSNLLCDLESPWTLSLLPPLPKREDCRWAPPCPIWGMWGTESRTLINWGKHPIMCYIYNLLVRFLFYFIKSGSTSSTSPLGSRGGADPEPQVPLSGSSWVLPRGKQLPLLPRTLPRALINVCSLYCQLDLCGFFLFVCLIKDTSGCFFWGLITFKYLFSPLSLSYRWDQWVIVVSG